jgi:N-acetylglucosamine-6-phosphate deacetylase
MTQHWIKPDFVFDGQEILPDLSLHIEDGQIVESSNAPQDAVPIAGCLTPGFIDLQVNGGGGIQLNSTPTAEAMLAIMAAHRKFGTIGILPTVITDHPDVLERAAEAALKVKGQPGILGLHIEGPHIAVARRGTHSADDVRPMDDQTMNIVAGLRDADVSVMITLAPEAATLEQIAALAQMGAVVSLGHTDAPGELIEAAIVAGAECGTHLFNAMSPMTSRAPGAVGGILTTGIPFGIICDGHHVDDRMIRLALRASAHRSLPFLVSDAMATVGGPDHFMLYGKSVRLQDGRLINAEGGLAGAHITQAEGVKRLVHSIEIALVDALRMAVTTPAALMKQPDLAGLLGRSTSDLLILDAALDVTGTLADELIVQSTIDADE